MAVESYTVERQKDNGAWTQVAVITDLTDLSFVDTVPADGVQVRYRAKATDDQGAESEYITGPYKTINYNNAPTVSGDDADLGTLDADPPEYTYSVDDADAADEVAVVVALDGQVLDSFAAVKEQEYALDIPDGVWLHTGNGAHTVTVTASDGKDVTARALTFTRATTGFAAVTAQATNVRATKITLTLIPHPSNWPIDATVTVRACNDAYAETPTWEDVPPGLINTGWYTFTNGAGEAGTWGVGVEVTAEQGGSGDPVTLDRLVIGIA